ncbi:TPA: DUF4236 domain-containing protein [Vibrio parahaemolyticus]|uniref:DUF4236 domain-containing protein n=1 Tax=Vibrio parahaemolyticus TaxID=670 RepID=UPI0011239400|nr:DUF4236 domain-containing protein [Vibrio parahaemolyticus]MBE4286485.1 DUF4236 domain-containing protein [Vibrio parahaemolyticus]TOH19121.1 hypothetical protein CGI90_03850 [Vibrio parahaemolyticus]HCG7330528.1 DUF4236 domain-containing protein [Vibrio parahaemolyticus]HCG9589107.1 DUF4236 domain-containing protein [Vibrio parahaemolyticus]HCH1183541.1 DUF4236 domain-containing protein [Vibrio parahaemolyticus]
MAIRFRKRINLGLVKLNFGKTGFTSVTIGGRWLSLSIGRRGTYLNGSLVGSGFSFRKRLIKPASQKQDVKPMPPLNDDKTWKYPPAGNEQKGSDDDVI